MTLSIIIPVYNVEDYLDECLRSIFSTMAKPQNYEVIIVNDGTLDCAMDIAYRYASEHDNLRILEQDNQGLSSARMNGLKLATGDYVWFVDSDDFLIGGGLEVILSSIKQTKASIIATPLLWSYTNSQLNHVDINQSLPNPSTGRDLLKTHAIPLWASQRFIIRRSLFEDPFLYFPSGLLHEDEYFGRVLLYIADKVEILSEPVYIYRQRGGSITSLRGYKSSSDIISLYKLLQRFRINRVIPDDHSWFISDIVGFLLSSYSIHADRPSDPAFRSFKRKNCKFIFKEYRKYSKEFFWKRRLGETCLILCPGFYYSTKQLVHRIHPRGALKA